MNEISFKHQNITDQVLLALENKIIRGEWEPSQRVYVEKLSKEFNISQTPIREALYKLAGMNLVIIEPRKGIYVTAFPKQDIIDLLEIRMALENLTINKILDIDEDIIKKMKDNLCLFEETIKTKDIVANNELDRVFHFLIIKTSGSKQLIRVYQNLYSHLSVQRLLYKDEKKALEELHTVDKEHRKIVQAFEKKDKREIRKIIRNHLNNVKQRIVKSS